jgi:hypothetical protein
MDIDVTVGRTAPPLVQDVVKTTLKNGTDGTASAFPNSSYLHSEPVWVPVFPAPL